MDEEDLAAAWTADRLLSEDTNPDWASVAAVQFLERHHLTLPALLAVLRSVWLEGWTIGDHAARAVVGDEPVWWGWDEGDVEGAEQTVAPADRQRASWWMQSAATIAQDIVRGRIAELARLLVRATAERLTAPQLAEAIRQLLTDTAWAAMTAITELVRASTAAAISSYRQLGVTTVQWTTEPDDRTCPRCLGLEAEGPIPAGATFADGSTGPPAHPRCRCYLVPA